MTENQSSTFPDPTNKYNYLVLLCQGFFFNVKPTAGWIDELWQENLSKDLRGGSFKLMLFSDSAHRSPEKMLY